MIESLSDFLWYWDAIAGLQPIVGGDPTFTRASSGLIVPDRSHRIRSISADFPRFPWVTIDGERVRVLLLEMARTSVALDSEDLTTGNWSSTGTPIVTGDDSIAPDGTVTADKVEDDDGAARESRNQGTITVADDSNPHAVAVFIRKQTGGPGGRIRVDLSGGTPITATLPFDPDALTVDDSDGDVDLAGIEDMGDWFAVFLVVSNDSSGNTSLDVRLEPVETAASTGFQHFWGLGIEVGAFPTSYKGVSAGSSVTRAVENCSWNGAPDPQAMVIYLDMVLVDPLATGNSRRFLQIGKSDDSDSRIFIHNQAANKIRLSYDPGTETTADITLTTPAVGERVQIVASLEADGSGRLVVSHAGADPTGSDFAAAAEGMATAWSDNVLWLNSIGTASVSAEKYRQVKIVKAANLDAAVDGTDDDELLIEMENLAVNQFGQVR